MISYVVGLLKATRRKPYGHVGYTRRDPRTGKMIQVAPKGVKPTKKDPQQVADDKTSKKPVTQVSDTASVFFKKLHKAGVTEETCAEVFSAPDAGITCENFELDDGWSSASFVGQLFKGNRLVGRLERTFREDINGNIVVSHGHFELDPQFTGQGIGLELFERSLNFYRKTQVDEIYTHANLKVGGYTWAKFGYEFANPTELANIRTRFLNHLNVLSEASGRGETTITKRQLGYAKRKVKNFKFPRDFAALVINGEQIGKTLLLGASWAGRYQVSPKSSGSKVFTAYASLAKSKLKKAEDGDDTIEGNDEIFIEVARNLGFLTEINNDAEVETYKSCVKVPIMPLQLVIKADRSKPYGHVGYTRRDPRTGKMIQVAPKGVKPIEEKFERIKKPPSSRKLKSVGIGSLVVVMQQDGIKATYQKRENGSWSVFVTNTKQNDRLIFSNRNASGMDSAEVSNNLEKDIKEGSSITALYKEKDPPTYRELENAGFGSQVFAVHTKKNTQVMYRKRPNGYWDIEVKNIPRDRTIFSNFSDRQGLSTSEVFANIANDVEAGAKIATEYSDNPPRKRQKESARDEFDEVMEGPATSTLEKLTKVGITEKTCAEVFSAPSQNVRCQSIKWLDTWKGVKFAGILYKDGQRIGEVERLFKRNDKGDLVVYHAYFKVGASFRGKGVAQELFERSLDFYRKKGVKEISVTANLDVGGYTWAKFGYEFADTSELEQMRRKFLVRLKKLAESAGDANAVFKKQQIAYAKGRIKKFEHPWEFAALVINGQQVGKDLLLGSMWRGVYPLTPDSDGLKVFDAYSKAAKSKLKKADDGDDPIEGNDDVFLEVARKLGFLTEITTDAKEQYKSETNELIKASADDFMVTVMTGTGSVQPLSTGRFGAKKVTFDNGTKAALKVKPFSSEKFRGIERDTLHLREAAAYQLDRQLLHWGIVPPTTLTTYKNVPASIQQWKTGFHASALVPHVFDTKIDGWKERVALFAAKIDAEKLRKVVIFDLIVNNTDRHGKNCLFDTFSNRVVAIDNGLCFGSFFRFYNNVFHRFLFRKNLKLTNDERRTLRNITLPSLKQVLGRYLTSRQILETFLRIQWVLAQPTLAFTALSPEANSKNRFPSRKEWFLKHFRDNAKTTLVMQVEKMGQQAVIGG